MFTVPGGHHHHGGIFDLPEEIARELRKQKELFERKLRGLLRKEKKEKKEKERK